jgi:hypothetical protein
VGLEASRGKHGVTHELASLLRRTATRIDGPEECVHIVDVDS